VDQVQARDRERLHAISWLPARGSSGREGLLVARVDEHGQLTPAGVVQLGLSGERRLALQQLAGGARTDRRLPLAGVLVDVDHHGARGGPLRDAVLRDVISEATGVSFAEQQARRSKYYDQPPFAFVPGYDVVGEVEPLGDGADGAKPRTC
jgi:hypothetical protein